MQSIRGQGSCLRPFFCRQPAGLSQGGLSGGRKTTYDPNHPGAPRPNPLEPGQDLSGVRDIPLNDQGREEARLAGEWLKGETIHAAYSSPLSRARDTAHAIARHHHLTVADLPGLTDLCYGDWEGLPLTEVKVTYAELYRQWETAPATVRFPGGETLDEVKARALGRWRRWCSATPTRWYCWRLTGR